MPDRMIYVGPENQEVDPMNLPDGWTARYRIDWTTGTELVVKGAGDVMRRILAKLPEPKDWANTGRHPKATDVLKALEAGDMEEAARVFAFLGYGNDPSRDGLVKDAVIANVKGEDDRGVGALLEHIIGAKNA